MRRQGFVDLEGEDTVKPLQQWLRERTPTGTDLENPRRIVSQQRGDALCDVPVDQKILTETATFGPAHGAQNSEFEIRSSE